MAKNKKTASSKSSLSKKKSLPTTDKQTTKRPLIKINNKKVEIISEKISRINKNFEHLILECQNALKNFTPLHTELK